MPRKQRDPATELGGRLSQQEVRILFDVMKKGKSNAPAQSAGVKAPTKERVKLA